MTDAVIEQEESGFAAGFNQVAAARTEQNEPPRIEAVAKEAPAIQAEAQPAVAEPPDPLESLKSENAALKTALEQESRKLNGKIGELNGLIQGIRKDLPAGKAGRKITAEMLRRVDEELPGLGKAFAEDFAAIFDSAEANAPAAQAAAEARGQSFDAEGYFSQKLAPALQAMEARMTEAAQAEMLEALQPGYEATVKKPEFAAWLKTLPAERQQTVLNSNRAVVAVNALKEFSEWVTKAEKDKARNKNRLEGAMTPRSGAGAHASPLEDDEAGFSQGFNSIVKKRSA